MNEDHETEGITQAYIMWQNAERANFPHTASNYKERYRTLIMKSLERPYLEQMEALKAYPLIYLN